MHPKEFKVAIITALPIEMSCAEGMLDEQYEDVPSPQDKNSYSYGRMGKYSVVLACLPSGVTGTVPAAVVAGRILNSFPNLRVKLMVGIGGGVPNMEGNQDHDIRLGDIVVSKPTQTFGGVVQYRRGKTVPSQNSNLNSQETSEDGQPAGFTRTGILNSPPDEVLTAVGRLESKHLRKDSDVSQYVDKMLEEYPKLQQSCRYQGAEHDLLFEAKYNHQGKSNKCEHCDKRRLVPRPPRAQQIPVVHYGTIASADEVMRHGATRDAIAAELGVLCFEMEAAGLMNDFQCLVIRGICDYADSHKNKEWQPYAAAVAAAYAKELLSIIPVEHDDNPSSQPQASVTTKSGPVINNQIFGGIHNNGGPQVNNASGTFYFGKP